MYKSPLKLGTSPYSGDRLSDDSTSEHGSREKDKTCAVDATQLDYISS